MDFLAAMSDAPAAANKPAASAKVVKPAAPPPVDVARRSYEVGKLTYSHGSAMLGVPMSTYRIWCHHAGGKFPTIEAAINWISDNTSYVLRPSDEAWAAMVLLKGDAAALKLCGGERIRPNGPRIPAHIKRTLERHPNGNSTVAKTAFVTDDEDEEPCGTVDSDDAAFDARITSALQEAMDDKTVEGRLVRTRILEQKIFRMSINRPDPKVLSAYKAICSLAMELERDLLEVIRIRDSMIEIDLVVGAASAAVSVVLAELRALPESAALRVNPINPAMAKEELDAIVSQLVASAQTQVDSQLTELLKLRPEEKEK